MESFLAKIEGVLNTRPETIQDIIKLITESENQQELKNQALDLLAALALEDVLDVCDAFFQSGTQQFQTDIIELITSFGLRAKDTYETLKKGAEEDIVAEDQFTSADCATIAQYLSELVRDNSVKLLGKSMQSIYEYVLGFFQSGAPQNQYTVSFFYQLATEVSLSYGAKESERVRHLAALALDHALNSVKDPCSNTIIFTLVCLTLGMPEADNDKITLYLINISKRSREYLLAVLAAYCHLYVDRGVHIPKQFGHLFLGQNERISSGVNSFVGQLSCENEVNDGSPGILMQYLIIQAKSDPRVARLIGSQELVHSWISNIIESGDQRYNQLAKEFGKILIRHGQQGGQQDWAGKLMNIISGGTNARDFQVDIGTMI